MSVLDATRKKVRHNRRLPSLTAGQLGPKAVVDAAKNSEAAWAALQEKSAAAEAVRAEQSGSAVPWAHDARVAGLGQEFVEAEEAHIAALKAEAAAIGENGEKITTTVTESLTQGAQNIERLAGELQQAMGQLEDDAQVLAALADFNGRVDSWTLVKSREPERAEHRETAIKRHQTGRADNHGHLNPMWILPVSIVAWGQRIAPSAEWSESLQPAKPQKRNPTAR